MLESYFVTPKTLKRLRSGPSAPYIDGFAAMLKEKGYSHSTAIRYLRVAAHLGYFLLSQGKSLTDVNTTTPDSFRRHLPTCRCHNSNGGVVNHHTFFGVKCFYRYLTQINILAPDPVPIVECTDSTYLVNFRYWLHNHRGLTPDTIRQYSFGASRLLNELADNPSLWDAKQIRTFFLESAKKCNAPTIEKLITSVRIFLRYLIIGGRCTADLDQAVPVFAHWRLTELPQSLTTDELEKLIEKSEGNSLNRIRDLAIILLLVRLGLRAGDVAKMNIDDIEWYDGSLRVSGKSRSEVRLPLPQDVGDAIQRYLELRPKNAQTNKLFVSNIVPYQEFSSGGSVSSVVKRALLRAGVNTRIKGAHVLRHTAATEMLRNGVPLDKIGLVLRHKRLDTTAYYAKVDVALLKQIAQPWPEALQ